MKIRLAMITDFPEAEDKIDGGVEAVASYLVDELAKAPNLDMHVLTLVRKRVPSKTVQEKGFVRHVVPFARLGSLTGFLCDQRNVNACLAAIRPDLVHAQEAAPHGILAMRSEYPAVVTIHGIKANEANFMAGLIPRIRARFQGWLGEYYCVRHASNTILISPYVAERYGHVLAGRSYLIPNPVASRFFEVVRNEMEGRILFAGRLTARKGLEDLIRALEKVRRSKNCQLILAGSTAENDYVDHIRREITRLGLTEAVSIRGILSSHEMLEELSRCTCLVLPSYQETAPMVIQEAMASGVPVIASNVCGIPHQVDDGITGLLFHPGDVDSLAHKLDNVISNRVMRTQFGLAARRKALQEYSAAAVARSTINVYRSVLV